ncbi:MerR family transcriptional regulator [Aurantimonas sp. Leaf443]|uniref:MerR family transcriptional regulator n=1 Tax=Aurantimonas sp. Leaf443 TaxID=1736378 RepID=UPI00070214B6|nr:MerR family transcriptional regulator [Aurantimonas sp. Leaf443]KQT88446.1 hypothetical protein ASG48_03265 [Aurantimonas sp. Leaf443]
MNDKSIDAFRTISEVAEDLDLPQHVLRFWETRFQQIRPMKRAGGRRYYRPDDVELLKGIRHLLYVKGFTIRGVQKILKENGNRAVMALGRGEDGLSLPQAPAHPDEPEVFVPEPEDFHEGADREAEPEFDELDRIVGLSPNAVPPSAPQRPETAGDHKSKGLAGLMRREPPMAQGNSESAGRALPRDSVEALDRVILQLLECKRLLDQVR